MIVGVWARGRVPIGTLLHSIKACDFLMITHLFGPFVFGTISSHGFGHFWVLSSKSSLRWLAWFMSAAIYLSTWSESWKDPTSSKNNSGCKRFWLCITIISVGFGRFSAVLGKLLEMFLMFVVDSNPYHVQWANIFAPTCSTYFLLPTSMFEPEAKTSS